MLSEVIQLKANNIDGILGKVIQFYFYFINKKCNKIILFSAKHELVFINFYVDWCRYSNLMQPVFDESARLVIQIRPGL